MKTIKVFQTTRVSVPLQEVWKWQIQTEQINRALGLPPMSSKPLPGENFTIASWRMFGIPMAWEERPFEWVEPEWLRVERNPLHNPLIKGSSFHIRLHDPGEGETKVEIEGLLDVSSAVPSSVLERSVHFLLRRFAKLMKKFEQEQLAGEKRVFLPSTSPEVNDGLLKTGLWKLSQQPVLGHLVQKLNERLRHSSDADCVNMRPFAIARDWREERIAVLRLFLHATACGLLEMRWEILCPNCRVSKASLANLSELKPQGHCDTCKINFNLNFDEFVELCFSPNPAVRPVRAGVYCLGNPASAPHILMQIRVQPNEERTVEIVLPPGKFQAWSRSCPEKIPIEVSTGESAASFSAVLRESLQANPRKLREGRCAFTFRNNLEKEALVVLEREAWDDTRATAAFVTALHEFRDLFPSQILARGFGLEIKHLTFLFSDLKSSTTLYEQIGDSPALSLVWDHFSLMAESIKKHNGGIVKTMGDAVMAAFSNASDALSASLEIQHLLREEAWKNKKVILKLGLHCGPCLAVSGKDGVDYFGTTVNVAARVQGLSSGGDLVFTEAILSDQAAKTTLDEAGLSPFPFQSELKGLSGHFQLYRVELPAK